MKKTFKLIQYINPKEVIRTLGSSITDLQYYRRYKSILNELEEEGKFKKLNISKNGDKLFIGVNLNPELLMYTEDSQESVELKFVSDAMVKYTNFLQNEGILDSIVADYERVTTDDYYGYVVQISYDFKKYNKSKMTYDIGYILVASTSILVSAYMLISKFV